METELGRRVAQLVRHHLESRTAEGEELDYKRAEKLAKRPNDLVQTISALANTRGGVLVFGVGEDDGRRPEDITGVSEPVGQPAERIGTSAAVNIRPQLPSGALTWHKVEVSDAVHPVVALHVRPSPRRPHMFEGRVWKRTTAGNEAADIDEVRAMVLEGQRSSAEAQA